MKTKFRKLRVGEIIRATDVFGNGHEVEKYAVGKKMFKQDKRFYQVWRLVVQKKANK